MKGLQGTRTGEFGSVRPLRELREDRKVAVSLKILEAFGESGMFRWVGIRLR